MTRLASTFVRLAAQRRKALIPYVTTGYPRPELALPVLRALVEGGADAIELGVPFSDPMADGPVIQRSNEQAIALGVGLNEVLGIVRAFRAGDAQTPIVLMGYANPIERFGVQRFLAQAAEAGVDGVLVVDYPPEECESFAEAARACGIDPVFLLAPTSTDARIERVLRAASGYVYYVSMKGTTGGTLDADAVVARVAAIRARTSLPVGVGFGIRDGAAARAVARAADAVIIGTRTIEVLHDGPLEQAPQRARDFVASIRAALDAPEPFPEIRR
ncbi:MAG: tryptophan synthase subunit alpha [Burkholderiaceae bacterium]|nr:tryptophan synthase subunit alpha [Burkholderiaceae bacterium]